MTLVALAVRIVFVLHYENPSPLAGDATYYHLFANLVADGRGFVDPYRHAADATHPPLYTLALAASSLVGLRSVLDHQLWSCVLGSSMVIVVGVTGREVVDATTGLVAAGITALYPAFWINDGLLMSETVVQVVIALLVLFVYRTLRRPSAGNAIAVGALCGLAALTRGEFILLPFVVIAPLAWSLHRHSAPRVLALGATMLGALVVVLAPWSLYNLGRFEQPVPISTQGGQTLAGANCPYTYTQGKWLGLWNYPCVLFHSPGKAPGQPGHGKDASELDALYRDNGIAYARSQLGRVPVVVLARIGRVFGVYRPLQQLRTESGGADGRPYRPGVAALLTYYLTVVAAVAGLLLFRRRGIPWWPPVSFAVLVTLTAAATYGASRFRVPLEVALMVPAAAAITAGTRAALSAPGRRNERHPAADEEDDEHDRQPRNTVIT